jgi:hypothetical protein
MPLKVRKRLRPIVAHDHLRWLVPSETQDDVDYMVDLGDKRYPSGRCECDDFNIRIESYLKKNLEPPCGRRTCIHIRRLVRELEHKKSRRRKSPTPRPRRNPNF